jgi:hypothetical protein
VGDVVQGNMYRHISFSATGATRMTNAAWAVTTSKTRASHRKPWAAMPGWYWRVRELEKADHRPPLSFIA